MVQWARNKLERELTARVFDFSRSVIEKMRISGCSPREWNAKFSIRFATLRARLFDKTKTTEDGPRSGNYSLYAKDVRRILESFAKNQKTLRPNAKSALAQKAAVDFPRPNSNIIRIRERGMHAAQLYQVRRDDSCCCCSAPVFLNPPN